MAHSPVSTSSGEQQAAAIAVKSISSNYPLLTRIESHPRSYRPKEPSLAENAPTLPPALSVAIHSMQAQLEAIKARLERFIGAAQVLALFFWEKCSI